MRSRRREGMLNSGDKGRRNKVLARATTGDSFSFAGDVELIDLERLPQEVRLVCYMSFNF